MTAKNPIERFWPKVDSSAGPDACWPWTAAVMRSRGGYGLFNAGTSRADRRAVGAHRFALELAIGRVLERHEYACHHCDNPICCNPAHLFVGTHIDNMRDMVAKSRHGQHGRTSCIRGHAITESNTYRSAKSGHFYCRDCRRERDAARRAA